MNILTISNTINALVESSEYFQQYHAGYHSDINTNIPNAYNTDGDVGKLFPLVLWAVPIEGTIKIKNGIRGEAKTRVELYFYDLQNHTQTGDAVPLGDTMIKRWDNLHTHAVEFIHVLRQSIYMRPDQEIEYFTDANLHNDNLLCVGFTFEIFHQYSCEAYQSDVPLAPVTEILSATIDNEVP